MILITGATGLVGSHLALHLAQSSGIGSETIRAIYRNYSGIEKTKAVFSLYRKSDLFQKIEWIKADIIDIPSLEAAFNNIDYVYHCAASISLDPAAENLLRKTNIEGTANIVNLCLSHKVKKLCYVSSIAALGDLKPHETNLTEETEWNPEKPHSDYAISKYGGEIEVNRGQQEGLQTVIVNPGVIIGPTPNHREWNSCSGEIFKRVANGLLFYSKGTTGFVSVNDVVKIMAALMETEISGERFILTSQNISYEKLLQMIADAMKVKRPSIYGRLWMTEISWKVDWLISAIFLTRRKFPKTLARAIHNTDLISNDKIKTVLKYEFDGIEEYINKIAPYYRK